MIVPYSGTPGSGKSLDTASTIYKWCRCRAPIICNFPVNVDNVRTSHKNTHYVPNWELDPDKLVEFLREYFKGKKCKEDSILLVIDEAQLLLNSRDWSKKGRDRWNWFFTMHRHFDYFIVLCTQFDRMLDRQVRGLIKYEYVHRKALNIGWKGLPLSCFMLCPVSLFVKVRIWYPMKERIDSEFFRCQRRYYSIYDTFAMIDTVSETEIDTVVESGEGKRGPAEASATVATMDSVENDTEIDIESPVGIELNVS